MKKIILASASPRRHDLLAEAGIDFDVVVSPAEEIHDALIPLHLLCEKNAELKSVAVAEKYPDNIVIGADTLVYIDKTPLGKPKDEMDAKQTLAKLSGRTHQVCTGVCVVKNGVSYSFHEITYVTFKKLTKIEIADYISKVHVMDKAGSYAAQDNGNIIIESIKGDYDNVIGLPVKKLLDFLKA